MRISDAFVNALRSYFWNSDLIPYEIGTWLPAYFGGTTAGTTSHSVQVGEYTRWGRVVQAQGRVTWTSATGTGVARISLPFTSANITSAFGAASIVTEGVTFAGASPQALIFPNTAYFELKYPANNANTVDITVEAAGTVFFSAIYIIA